jgi:hypothetical protein
MGFTADYIVYHELVMTSKEYMQVTNCKTLRTPDLSYIVLLLERQTYHVYFWYLRHPCFKYEHKSFFE